jgi:transposase
VCPARETGVGLILPEANAQTMNLHLAEVGRAIAPGAFGVIILDGAGWHQTGGRLVVPANLALLHLPPYSPELNPVENVWQYLRQNFLSNRVFENYEAIVDACCDAWNALMALPERIRSITQRDWTNTVSS